MSGPSLPTPSWELSERWTSVPQAPPAEEADPRQRRRWVQFVHAGNAVCLPLEAIERVVPRLGRLVPLAGAPHLAGIALVGGQPLPVVDFQEAAGPAENRPALVTQLGGGRIALAVEGPTDLIEATFAASPGVQVGPFLTLGLVDGSVAALSLASVTAWIQARLELER